VRVESRESDELGPDDVRIEVAACGICGSDLHEYAAGPIFVPEEPHDLTNRSTPIRMGHEFSGTITATGTNVSDHDTGDAVVVNPILSCGDCQYCDEGKYNLCESTATIGLSASGGGFSEETVVPASNVLEIPDGVPLEYGALIEPYSVALHAVRRSSLSAGDTVAIFGAGPIGLTLVQMVQVAGAGAVYVSEPRAARREKAEEIGADITIDPTEINAVDSITAHTDGGVDVAIEVAGIEASINAAINGTRRDGDVTIVSISEGDISLEPNDIVTTERTIRGTFTYSTGPVIGQREFSAVARLLEQEQLDPAPLITGRIPLDDIVEDGFESLLDDSSEHIKILVEP
jgi:(R,R)-butanediol dehydrogenase/meso-butanediol dehydrogenase/diacetyl reductase